MHYTAEVNFSIENLYYIFYSGMNKITQIHNEKGVIIASDAHKLCYLL